MSSPVVNKDTLYYYKSGITGDHCIGFLYTPNSGWSRTMTSHKTRGWEWNQTKEYSGKPIGQRCILQW